MQSRKIKVWSEMDIGVPPSLYIDGIGKSKYAFDEMDAEIWGQYVQIQMKDQIDEDSQA